MGSADWLDPAATLLIATVFGGMVYFAATVAPIVFRNLAADEAGRLIRRLFPPYYRLGAWLTVGATILLTLGGHADALATALVALLFFAAWLVLMPKINLARDREVAGEAAAGRHFARLHRLSVALNLLQMAILAAVLARLAA